jgi:XTP/dITP diphosphohydrolase
MTHRLLVGSNNVKKRAEIQTILRGLDLVAVTPQEVGIVGEPEETGETFAENAAIKALFYSAASGLLTLADDSGLMVDAIDGLPGVRSSRYAGEQASDEENCQKLIEALRDVPDSKRTARFHCAIAVAEQGKIVATAAGECVGRILHKKAGTSGFGYDPLFFFPPEGMAFAQLPPETKNRVSHRGAALRQIREALSRLKLDESESV